MYVNSSFRNKSIHQQKIDKQCQFLFSTEEVLCSGLFVGLSRGIMQKLPGQFSPNSVDGRSGGQRGTQTFLGQFLLGEKPAVVWRRSVYVKYLRQ